MAYHPDLQTSDALQTEETAQSKAESPTTVTRPVYPTLGRFQIRTGILTLRTFAQSLKTKMMRVKFRLLFNGASAARVMAASVFESLTP